MTDAQGDAVCQRLFDALWLDEGDWVLLAKSMLTGPSDDEFKNMRLGFIAQRDIAEERIRAASEI